MSLYDCKSLIEIQGCYGLAANESLAIGIFSFINIKFIFIYFNVTTLLINVLVLSSEKAAIRIE